MVLPREALFRHVSQADGPRTLGRRVVPIRTRVPEPSRRGRGRAWGVVLAHPPTLRPPPFDPNGFGGEAEVRRGGQAARAAGTAARAGRWGTVSSRISRGGQADGSSLPGLGVCPEASDPKRSAAGGRGGVGALIFEVDERRDENVSEYGTGSSLSPARHRPCRPPDQVSSRTDPLLLNLPVRDSSVPILRLPW